MKIAFHKADTLLKWNEHQQEQAKQKPSYKEFFTAGFSLLPPSSTLNVLEKIEFFKPFFVGFHIVIDFGKAQYLKIKLKVSFWLQNSNKTLLGDFLMRCKRYAEIEADFLIEEENEEIREITVAPPKRKLSSKDDLVDWGV